ncbi:hypothetical protein GCM10020218_085470 [Dactylosporangium vinaceum]|uniref:Tyrosine-type recombinase/integrase n=1 Tax=Dactylosporangium vinaceum TaxID=53362 RepID=A0ABV5MQN0_9ACTN
MTDAALVRKVLDQLALKTDGKAAAPNTVARKRAVFYGALRYAVELRRLDAHPMDFVQWSAPKNDEEVDRRVVVNPAQARLLLEAVQQKDPRLTAFFGCMYFAALRPAEVLHLRLDDCKLPETGWGSLHLTGSTQRAGQEWSDSGAVMEDRALKHRPANATRIVPAAPELVRLLQQHIDVYGAGPDGRLFVRRYYQYGPVSKETYNRVWRQARATALTESQQRSPLARVP